MKFPFGRSGWVGRLGLFTTAVTFLLTGCATGFIRPATAPEPAPTAVVASDDDDFSQLVAQLRSDLSRYNKREAERQPSARARENALADKAKALFTPLAALHMPVVGVTAGGLDDSWGAPRDGGERRHKGIDIFAPRGTSVVAVIEGIISYIGDQPKGGHCLWLTTESGTSFYYAHLDRWAPGLYEGMEVQTGDLLGFVGNTGNAITTPPHLHFGINQNDDMVNPYPILTRAIPVKNAHVHAELGGGYGTR
ncbi:MAG TPA: M23 family metallopeptidase [Thermoanaerobaculia bacterium]